MYVVYLIMYIGKQVPGLTPLSVDWMYVVYLIMYIGKQVPWPYTSVCGLGVCGVSHHVHR